MFNSASIKKECKALPPTTNTKEHFTHKKKWYNLDVLGFRNVVYGNNILVIKKAFIRDDGENNFLRGDGDIGLHIYYSKNRIWKLFKIIRLFGPHYHGNDTDGSEKYEWSDYKGVNYKNYGILKWRYFPGKYIRIKLKEGDHGLTKDDIVFDQIIEVKKLKSGNIIRVDGDLSKKEATLWFWTYEVLTID